MKRFIFIANLILFAFQFSFAQSGKIIDDIYVSPNDAQMVKELTSAKKAKAKNTDNESVVYRNGAKEIVFIDQNGNKTTAVSDTVYIVNNKVKADSIVSDTTENEKGYYLNGFNGTKSDLEYADRIHRFHDPRYTITIADPGYNDIYFLDNDYWNVYMDGMYATITPTWTNPYWWNYEYAPFSYGSWAWRLNWGYPLYGSWGWGWNGWYDPWMMDYYGWYNPWYYGMYGGGWFGWDYPWYGGYYGWGYPYYGGYGFYGNHYYSQDRRGSSRGTYNSIATGTRTPSNGRQGILANSNGRYTIVSNERNDFNSENNLRTGRSSVATANNGVMNGRNIANSVSSERNSRTSFAPNVDTRTRTGAVRSSGDWSNLRNSRTYSSGYSNFENRTSPSYNNSSRNNNSYNSERSNSSYSRSYENTTRSSRSSSYDGTNSGRSSGSFSTGSSSVGRSSGGSFGGGGSSSGRSSGGGGGRR